MVCPKCGSTSVTANTSTYVVSKSRSFIWNLLRVFLTGGLWLLWMLIRKRKEKTVTDTWATCQECGYRWKL